MRNWQALAIAAFVVWLIAVSIYIEVGVWQECRTDHSFFYCLKLVSK